MREKGYEDREESGGLGSEESRRDEWDGNGNEVERCWEDVVEGHGGAPRRLCSSRHHPFSLRVRVP